MKIVQKFMIGIQRIKQLSEAKRLCLLLLCIAGLAGFAITKQSPRYFGDWPEYYLMTHAIAARGTPDIQLKDIIAIQQSVDSRWDSIFRTAADDIRTNSDIILGGALMRAFDGHIYAIHHFGYSALAAVAHKLTGLSIGKSFVVVNACFMLLFAWAAYQFFRNTKTVCVAILLLMSCGGLAYWNWPSPEFISATALLSGLLLFHVGAPGTAAIALGLAAMQNPTVGIAFVVMPAFYMTARWMGLISQLPWINNWSWQRSILTVLLIAFGLVIATSHVVFNFVQFGTPSIIAKFYTDPNLIGWQRLKSFFLDLNQGMLPYNLGLFLVLVLFPIWIFLRIKNIDSDHLVLSGMSRMRVWGSFIAYPLLALILSLGMILPALAATNWNSAAEGQLRYAFWASMPFLFALLINLERFNYLLYKVTTFVVSIQFLMSFLLYPVDFIHHTALARLLFAHAPAFYNPDAEIFVERLLHVDAALDREQIYKFQRHQKTTKVLFHQSNLQIDRLLCGDDAHLSATHPWVDADSRGWVYINGAIQCNKGAKKLIAFSFNDIKARGKQLLVSGWNTPEGGNEVGRVWSQGANSTIQLNLEAPQSIAAVAIIGDYYLDNRNTRVLIDGVDFGLMSLMATGGRIELGQRLRQPIASLKIELQHQNPQSPSKFGSADTRELAFALRSIKLQSIPQNQ